MRTILEAIKMTFAFVAAIVALIFLAILVIAGFAVAIWGVVIAFKFLPDLIGSVLGSIVAIFISIFVVILVGLVIYRIWDRFIDFGLNIGRRITKRELDFD